MIRMEAIVTRASTPLSTEIDGETVLMDVESGRYYALNTVGTAIWRHLMEPREVAALCAQLEQEYVGDADIIRRDVLNLLEEMHENRLVHVMP